MAKWGEGDPRWIVEERPDATNVNNWHWTEKNACSWSQEKLKELLTDVVIDGKDFKCKTTEVQRCEGEAIASNRKGKLIFFYEWNITLVWKCLDSKDKSIEGNINIPNLSEENDISEVDVEVTLKTSTDEGEKVKSFLCAEAKEIIRQKLGKYVKLLKEEFSKGMILPKKDSNTKENHSVITPSVNIQRQMNTITLKTASSNNSNNVTTTTIKQRQKFQCRSEDFFNVMTTPNLVAAFTKGPVKLVPEKNGVFEIFGGNIYGEFVELSAKKIVQKWRCKQWPLGHFSEVILDINEKNDHTEVNLTQTGVPINDEESTKGNWDRYYWDAIKRTFNYGCFI